MLEKCKWYLNSKTTCCLMIDDIVPIAITNCSYVGPYNDWGYLKDAENSLYTYLKQYLFGKYPEIRGTIFLPFLEHNNIISNGYTVLKGQFDNEYISFLKKLSNQFEFAFHGINHHTYKNGILVHEFSNYDRSNNEIFKNIISEFLNNSGFTFEGGKFPGYKHNTDAIKFLETIGLKWIALQTQGINKKISDKNLISYLPDNKLINLPTNLTGDVFNRRINKTHNIKKLVKQIIFPDRVQNFEKLLENYYHNEVPIIIQEHWQNLHTNGKRQTPTLFDDLYSLDKIFSLLRGADIWYATCTEIAHYFDCFQKTIISQNNDIINISYNGLWENLLLSVKSDLPQIKNLKTGNTIHGILKNGKWIYNNLTPGNYQLI